MQMPLRLYPDASQPIISDYWLDTTCQLYTLPILTLNEFKREIRIYHSVPAINSCEMEPGSGGCAPGLFLALYV